MGQRTQRQQPRPGSDAPGVHHVARVGEQGVVRVHDAFGHARGAGGEGEIGDLVRIRDRISPRPRARLGDASVQPDGFQMVDPVKQSVEAGIGPVGAPARFRVERRRLEPLQQRHHLGAGMRPMQRRVAGIALTGAGQEQDDGLHPVAAPDRDTVAFDEPARLQIGGNRVRPVLDLAPAQPPRAVAQRRRVAPALGVAFEQAVERLFAPDPALVVALRRPGRVQCQKGTHASRLQCPKRSGSGGRRSRKAVPSSFDSSLSR